MNQEWKENLWNEYITATNLSEEKRIPLKNLGNLLIKKVSFLYEVYSSIGKAKESCKEQETGIMFEAEDDKYKLKRGETEVCMRKEEMKSVLRDMIGLFQEILPLGSVVDLKKEKLSETMDVSDVKQFRVIIIKRFIGDEESVYYPYGAVLYPIGTAGAGRLISFTPALIDKIIFTGYSDEKEEAFIYQMKQELIITQRRKSAGFATKQELKELSNNMIKAEERNEGCIRSRL